MGKKKEKLETNVKPKTELTLENKIRLMGALHLREEKGNPLAGGSKNKYFARLYLGIVSYSEKIPEGIKVNNFPDYLDIEIPEKTYNSLSRSHLYAPYGSIKIELGVEDPHPFDI